MARSTAFARGALQVEPASMTVPVITQTVPDLDEDEASPLLVQAQALVQEHHPGTALRDVARRLVDDELSK